VVDNFSWIRGKHSFRFGGDYRYNQFLQVGNEFARGRFTFSGSFTGNANTLAGGYNGADFLLGSPTVIEARRFPQQRDRLLLRRHVQGDASPHHQLGAVL
jgi:hypothetical protein